MKNNCCSVGWEMKKGDIFKAAVYNTQGNHGKFQNTPFSGDIKTAVCWQNGKLNANNFIK